MKRSTSVLSSALLGTGLLMSVGVHAQTTVAAFGITTTSTATAVNSILDFSIFLTTDSSESYAGFVPNIAFDSRYFAINDPDGVVTSGFTVADGKNQIFDRTNTNTSGAKVTANNQDTAQALTSDNANPAVPNYVSTRTSIGLKRTDGASGAPVMKFNNTFVGSYSLKIIAALPISGSQVGFTNFFTPYLNTPKGNQVGDFSNNFASGGKLRFTPGSVKIGGAVPAPGSVAVFAMGGLIPAVAMLRRRKAKTN
ncbi:MAG: hypothetical protein H7308_00965 [Chthonomonadaceae bacterium]|nr:hypothetical protein [Chthonomonadaceae bacterium]